MNIHAIRYNMKLNQGGLAYFCSLLEEFLVPRVYYFVQGVPYHPIQYTGNYIYRVVLRNLSYLEAFEARDYYAVPYS